MSAIDAFRAHMEQCQQCRQSLLGMPCPVALRLLGEAAGMRQDNGQLELLHVEAEPAPRRISLADGRVA